MAQTTILATGTTAATSTDIVVAAGASVTVGAYVASGSLPMGGYMSIVQDTPGADNPVDWVGLGRPTTVIVGPGTFRVVRPATATAVGAFTES